MPPAAKKPSTVVKPAREKTDTRERILRATLRVIGEHGVEAVSNRRLAKEAGVALGSLTYHFPSQTELLRESLLLYVNEEVARLNAIAETIRAGEPTVEQVAAEVERIFISYVYGPEQIAELELHLQAARDPELQDASRRCFAAYDDVAIAALQALRLPATEVHARAVVALVSGVALRFLGTGVRDDSGLALALTTLARGAETSPDS
ncbi:MAG: TetR family transcriptional regulator [Thermoleophilia bacterium]|nr:TetR family transcriptional regulator [Thermoleophilia bacterium]